MDGWGKLERYYEDCDVDVWTCGRVLDVDGGNHTEVGLQTEVIAVHLRFLEA